MFFSFYSESSSFLSICTNATSTKLPSLIGKVIYSSRENKRLSLGLGQLLITKKNEKTAYLKSNVFKSANVLMKS